MQKPKFGSGRSKRQHRVNQGNERGLFAIRRTIHEDSLEVLGAAIGNLTDDFRGVDRLFTAESLLVTVVGFKRYTSAYRRNGPSTEDMQKRVRSSFGPIEATIGRLGIYGSGNEHKLAFKLESEQLDTEISAYEGAFRDAGYPLNPDPNSPQGPVGHCSVAWVHRSNIAEHSKRSQLRTYDVTAGIRGETILLAPPKSR